jgi:hypothetical protein
MIGQITASNVLNNSRHCALSLARAPSAITQSRWLSAMPRRRSAPRLVSLGGSAAAAFCAPAWTSGANVAPRNDNSIRI